MTLMLAFSIYSVAGAFMGLLMMRGLMRDRVNAESIIRADGLALATVVFMFFVLLWPYWMCRAACKVLREQRKGGGRT